MIRVGIIGYGKMGRIRAEVLKRIPDTAIAAIADPVKPDKKTAHGARTFLNHNDMLRERLDCVFVCTPNYVTPKAVIDSMLTGRHVFCEKPPGRNLQDIKDIMAAEKKKNVKLKFGFNHRLHDVIKEAKSIVERGRLGRLLWMRGIYGKSGESGFKNNWRYDRDKAGGGILLDQGIHMIDLFRNFAGDFDEVKSVVTTSHWDTELEDNAFVILRNKNNQIATLHSSATQWKHTFSLDLCMEKGYIVINGILSSTRSYGRETLIVARKQEAPDDTVMGQPREEVTYFDKDNSWRYETEDFIHCVKNDKPIVEGTSLDAMKAMALVEKIYKADRKWHKNVKAR